ncbi:MAG: hypothetical protein HYR75_02380, partial [Gemmatimonadetes bacterium]|nr:hypothetical protein [Gemmatimonadota bacterium]
MRRLFLLTGIALPLALRAQGDYVDTDRGRPWRIEDATPLERFALDLQLTPVRLERLGAGTQRWGIEPSLAYGIAALTQLEVGMPLVTQPPRGGAGFSGAGVDLSLLHALTIEREHWPAIALAASAWLPAGAAGPSNTTGSVGARITRSFSGPVRVHLNYDYTVGAPAAKDLGTIDRWSAGVGLDHALPLRSLLVGVETFAAQPYAGGDLAYTSS